MLSKRHIQRHHDNEANDGSPAGQGSIALSLTLGDDVVHHDVDHGPGGEGEGVGEDGDYPGDQGSAQNPRHRLHQPRQLTIPETVSQ